MPIPEVPSRAADADGLMLSLEDVSELGGGGLAWQTSSVEEASMLRTCRASGSSVRAEMRGSVAGGVGGRAQSVAARRTSRRRPSGKAAAT
ncbi:MAG: hypothetical protein NVSMB34_09540 [Variovorax sp.]